MRIRSILFGTIFTLLVAASTVHAMRVYVPREVYVDRARYIVSGTMKNVDETKGTGTIQIKRFFKGKMDTDTVKVRFRKKRKPKKKKGKKGGLTVQTSPNLRGRMYQQGQRGIWFLMSSTKSDDGRYDVSNAAYYREAAAANQIEETVKSLKRLPWSDPAKGLSARLLVHQPGNGNARYRLIYLVLKNTTKKPILVNGSPHHTRVKASIENPEGKTRTIDLAPRKKRQKPKKQHFIRLDPGQTRYVPYRHGFNSGKLKKSGEYVITVCYINKYDGSRAGVKDQSRVWTGRICARPVTVEAKEN